jgi:signal transduction histidine kinase
MVIGAIYIGDTARVAREHDATLQSRIAAVEEEGRLRERAAVAAERTQAARDLHDSIGHTMSLIVVQSGMARMLETTKAADAAERTAGALGAIERAARAALGEMDAMLNVVVDPARPAPGMAVASEDLSGLTAEVRAAGTPVHLVCDDTAGLSPALRSGIFRLVQEALTNVMKHAPGATVTVRVRRGAGDVEISVMNTAVPGWTGELPSGSRGLMGMRERVADLGGELSAGPDGRGGFEVHAVLPLDGPARQVHHDLGMTGGGT